MSVSFLFLSREMHSQIQITGNICESPETYENSEVYTIHWETSVEKNTVVCFVDTFPPPTHGHQAYLWTLLDTLFIQTQALKIPAGVQDCRQSTNQ